jgi:hypothetical protein
MSLGTGFSVRRFSAPQLVRRAGLLLALIAADCPNECGNGAYEPRDLNPNNDYLKCGSAIQIVAGDAQEAQAGGQLPVELVVKATITPGNAKCSERPAAGETITWVVDGVAVVSPVSSTTDGAGEARTRVTLGPQLGIQRVTAQWVDVTPNAQGPRAAVTFSAVGLSAPYRVMRKVAGDAQTGPALARLTILPEVRLLTVREAGPQLGKREVPIDRVLVEWTVTAGGGSVETNFATTNFDGRVSREWTLGPAAGTHSLRALADLGLPPDPRDTLSVTFTATAVVEPVQSVVLTPSGDMTVRLGEPASITARTFAGAPLVEVPGRSVAWRSRNETVATVVPNAGTSPSTVTIRAVRAGTVDIDATSENVTATTRVTVPPAPARPARIAYGVANNAAPTATYAASFAYNSNGGPITITPKPLPVGFDRGIYHVVIPGQRGGAGETETILVSAYSSENTYCKLGGDWTSGGAPDIAVDVYCYDYRNEPANSSFSIMLLGSGALEGRFGFALADQPSNPGPYTPTKSFNSGALNPPPASVRRTGVGDYVVTFPGNERGSSDPPEALHVTTVNAYRCNVASFAGASARVRCYDRDGATQDAAFAITLLDRGRPTQRAAHAWAVNAIDDEFESGGTFTLEPRVWYSTAAAGNDVKLVRRGEGAYDVVFNGFAQTDASPVLGVQVVDRDVDEGHYCNVVGWAIEGVNLRVSVQCWNNTTGEENDEGFYLIVVQ